MLTLFFWFLFLGRRCFLCWLCWSSHEAFWTGVSDDTGILPLFLIWWPHEHGFFLTLSLSLTTFQVCWFVRWWNLTSSGYIPAYSSGQFLGCVVWEIEQDGLRNTVCNKILRLLNLHSVFFMAGSHLLFVILLGYTAYISKLKFSLPFIAYFTIIACFICLFIWWVVSMIVILCFCGWHLLCWCLSIVWAACRTWKCVLQILFMALAYMICWYYRWCSL